MAKVDRSHIRKGGEVMRLAEQQSRAPPRTTEAPVRVKLERINCDLARSLPPDGDHHVWFDRLMAVCGSASPDFVIPCFSFRPPRDCRTVDGGECCAGHDRKRAAQGRDRVRDRGPNGLRACGDNGRPWTT
jgi:hypothetical protein